MVLYSGSTDPFSQHCRFVLFEKGMDFEIRDIDLYHKPEDINVMNPYGEVPILVERDLVLYESNIINEYIDERFPHPQLMPPDPVERARTRLLLFNLEREIFKHVHTLENRASSDEARVKARINVGGFMWIINIALVVLGFVFLGIKCMGWTIYSSFALSFFVSGCEWLYPSGVSLSGDAMLDLMFAVFLPALGAAIVFDIGASTGGTDIVALILAKYTSMEIGKALMVSDILIVLAAAVRFGMGTGLYCILGLIGKSFVVDGAIENIRLRKVCTIMTANPYPILDFIIHNMNRSATVEKAYGAYTHHELSVLVTVLTRRQALQLRNFLRENDPHSFITIVNSSEIIGKGFRSFN